MKALLFISSLLLLLLTITYIINLTGIIPTDKYLSDQCTRYCHNSHCPHFESKVKAKNALALKIQPAYQTAIHSLKFNPFGLSYTTINLLVFVFGFPVLIFFLSFNLLRKWKK